MYSRNIKLEIITLMQSCVPEASIYLYSLYLILNYTHFHCITLPLLPKYLHTNFQTWPSLFSHPSSGASSFTALCPTRNWDRSTRSVVVLHSLMFSEQLHILRPHPAPGSCSLSTKRSPAQLCVSPGVWGFWTRSPPPRTPRTELPFSFLQPICFNDN